MKSLQLITPDGKDFKVHFRTPSGKLQTEIEALERRRNNASFMKTAFAMMKNGASFEEAGLTGEDTADLQPIITALQKGDLTVEEVAGMYSREFSFADCVEYFKTIIDRKQLKTEQEALIDSVPEKDESGKPLAKLPDFWLEQNAIELRSAVDYFRGLFKTGQGKD